MSHSAPALVSVVIPLYNHARYIERCLDSIRDDSYPNTEIVIIDDGSRDGSYETVQQWRKHQGKDYRGRFEIIRRENRGVARTLNELVAHATGEYIAEIASDDYLLPGGIASRVDYLRGHPDKMAVFADCTVVDEQGERIHGSGLRDLYGAEKAYLAIPELLAYELIITWCVPGPVFMARRDLYPLIGGYDETMGVEDWDFYLRMLARNLLGFIDYPVAAYRIHGGSSMHDTDRYRELQENIIRTITKNCYLFTGLKKFLLLGLRTRMIGSLAKHTRENRVMGSLRRKAGRRMLKVGKLIYRISVLLPAVRRQAEGIS